MALGSGCIISKNLLLSSAHNFFRGNKIVKKGSIKIYPGAYGVLKNNCTVSNFYIPKQFEANK